MIMPNLSKKNALDCTKQVCEILHQLDAEILIENRYYNYIKFDYISYDAFDCQLKKCDIVIVIGGDGTIIHAAKHAVLRQKPILGINVGFLGFLAALEQHEIPYLHQLVMGDYQLEKRMMLEVEHRVGNQMEVYQALNDVVISKGALSRVVDLNVYCNETYVSSYRADGIIFSTPTGSTAYALSAGGPIVEPSMDLIGMTPISPHSLFGRTILFGAENILDVRVNEQMNSQAYMTVDGETEIKITKKDELTIRKSNIYVEMVQICKKPFYEVLNKKLIIRAGDL